MLLRDQAYSLRGRRETRVEREQREFREVGLEFFGRGQVPQVGTAQRPRVRKSSHDVPTRYDVDASPGGGLQGFSGGIGQHFRHGAFALEARDYGVRLGPCQGRE